MVVLVEAINKELPMVIDENEVLLLIKKTHCKIEFFEHYFSIRFRYFDAKDNELYSYTITPEQYQSLASEEE